ncbi:CDP-alcohol phosphatidyltransferase-domain-containing protein, partial [Globomyces pollinis-pini]
MLEWYPNVVSDEALKGLKKYKYSAVDLSPISKYILSPYWTWAATLFPIWMAPNLITLTGFFFVLFNFICMFVFIPDMETAGPSWCYFSFGIGLFLYSTFDNVDGKQARRTNSSSPLGELFDHGVDALNCTTGALIQCAGLGLGLGNYAFLTLAVVSSAFFFSTWETFYTGTLFLGEFNGPTEGLLITISCLFLSGYFGPQIWKTEVASILPFLKDFIGQVNFGQALILFAIFTLIVYQIPFNAKRAVQACEEKKIDPSEAFVNAVNYLIYVGAAALWFYTPESVIIPKNTIVFLLAFGIGVARLNAMIVLAHVTHT